jgi:D-alanine--poly(phosphoribitol) ligase subunit 2
LGPDASPTSQKGLELLQTSSTIVSLLEARCRGGTPKTSSSSLGRFDVLATELEIRQWLIDTLLVECDIRVSSLDQRLFEDDVIDSMALVTLIVAIEEKWHVDFGLKDIDREAWATPSKIAADIFDALA